MVPFYTVRLSELQARTRETAIAGIAARIFGASDTLLHVCGHASYSPSRASLRWATDAWYIVQRASDLDWDLFVDSVRRSGLALPLSVMLRYLCEDLGAAVPASALHRLSTATLESGAMERQLALRGVRSGHASVSDFLKRTTKWRERAFLIQWLLFPTPRYLSWVDEIPCGWLLPFHYVYRPVHYAACRMRTMTGTLLRRLRAAAEQWIDGARIRSHDRPR
jgi:hypothetical protein